jgi:SPP1 family predicted phage head-tail adaptor
VGCNPKLCLDPSDLNKRVEIQAVQSTKNGRGGQVETWNSERTVWAAIEPTGGWEKFTSGKTEATVTHKVRMRYFPNLTAAKRLKYGERILHILLVRDIDERHAVYELKCEERA